MSRNTAARIKVSFTVAAALMLGACANDRSAAPGLWNYDAPEVSAPIEQAMPVESYSANTRPLDVVSLKRGEYRKAIKTEHGSILHRILANSHECTETTVTSIAFGDFSDEVAVMYLDDAMLRIASTETTGRIGYSAHQTKLIIEYDMKSNKLTLNGKPVEDEGRGKAFRVFAAGIAHMFGGQCEEVRHGRKPTDNSAQIAVIYKNFLDAVQVPSSPKRMRKPIELHAQAKDYAPG